MKNNSKEDAVRKIGAIGAKEAVAKQKEDLTALKEQKTFEDLEKEDFKQGIELRKEYASKIYRMLVAWLAAMIIIIFCSGFPWLELSDAILIALITTTTANVTVFFTIVTKYLFPKP